MRPGAQTRTSIAARANSWREIEQEAEVARRLGLPASFSRECPLPFELAGAIRFEHQAQFNPCKYLLGLAQAVRSAGGQLFEGTRARSIEHGEPPGHLTRVS